MIAVTDTWGDDFALNIDHIAYVGKEVKEIQDEQITLIGVLPDKLFRIVDPYDLVIEMIRSARRARCRMMTEAGS